MSKKEQHTLSTPDRVRFALFIINKLVPIKDRDISCPSVSPNGFNCAFPKGHNGKTNHFSRFKDGTWFEEWHTKQELTLEKAIEMLAST